MAPKIHDHEIPTVEALEPEAREYCALMGNLDPETMCIDPEVSDFPLPAWRLRAQYLRTFMLQQHLVEIYRKRVKT